MCVPLRTTDEMLGALYVDSLSGAGRFNEADLELLAAIGNQAGVAMHRVRLMGELERLLLDTIRRSPPPSTRATGTRTGTPSASPRSPRSSRASSG